MPFAMVEGLGGDIITNGLNRMVSVTHGRPAMISDELASNVPLPVWSNNVTTQDLDRAISLDFSKIAFFTKSVELYEIVNSITLAFYSSHRPRRGCKKPLSPEPSGYGSRPPQGLIGEDIGTVMKLDESLTHWEHSLPDHVKIKSSAHADNKTFQRQAVILRIR